MEAKLNKARKAKLNQAKKAKLKQTREAEFNQAKKAELNQEHKGNTPLIPIMLTAREQHITRERHETPRQRGKATTKTSSTGPESTTPLASPCPMKPSSSPRRTPRLTRERR